ncbi:MAG: hypothetical protein ABL927_14565 [Bdellovibrionales bacterium]
MNKIALIVSIMFLHLTANAYRNLTPDERLQSIAPGSGANRSDQELKESQRTIDQMPEGEDKKKEQIELNDTLAKILTVKCEQAFLKKEGSALEICKDFPYEPFECNYISTYMI